MTARRPGRRALHGAVLAVLAAIWLLAGALPAAAAVPQVVMVQNSGWMEPFYADPASQFKPLVQALVQALGTAGGELQLVQFNQSTATHASPQRVARGTADAVASAVPGLTLQRKGSGASDADTDFFEAITGTIRQHLETRPGVLWLVTNNRNSPNNDQRTAARNLEFYRFIHGDEQITRIVAYPLFMPVKGRLLNATGLIVYGIAYGEASAGELDRLVATNLKALFPEPPLRLKPQSTDAVDLAELKPLAQPGVRIFRDPANRLHLEFEASRNPGVARLEARFRNTFNAYAIESARLGASFGARRGDPAPVRVSIAPPTLTDLAPGTLSQVVRLQLQVPPVPSMWSREVLFSNGYSVPGELTITLDEQKLVVGRATLDRLAQLFPGDPLPDLFKPDAQVRASSTRLSLVVDVVYPVAPLLALTGAALALLASAGGLAFVLLQPKVVQVVADGDLLKVRLKPFETRQMGAAGSVRRGLTGVTATPAEQHTLSIRA